MRKLLESFSGRELPRTLDFKPGRDEPERCNKKCGKSQTPAFTSAGLSGSKEIPVWVGKPLCGGSFLDTRA